MGECPCITAITAVMISFIILPALHTNKTTGEIILDSNSQNTGIEEVTEVRDNLSDIEEVENTALAATVKESVPDHTPQSLIAHAGGAIYGHKYTNSLEALDETYSKGTRFIELDLDWTSDGEMVLIHDWEYMSILLFGKSGQLTLQEYSSKENLLGLTHLTFFELIDWLEEHKDTIIITDIKTDNIKALKYIADEFPEYIQNFIPQVYNIEEYHKVVSLGYPYIMLTLYKVFLTDKEVLNFCKDNPEIYAIVMPEVRGYTKLPSKIKELSKDKIKVYVHTVNEVSEHKKLIKNGVFGIYTDYF